MSEKQPIYILPENIERTIGRDAQRNNILAGKLLENAEKLLDMKIHPTLITKGYNLSAVKAREFLNEVAVDVSLENKNVLKAIAMTAMTGKGAESVKEKFSEIIVDAIAQIEDNGKIDIGNIKIEKNKSNGVEDTELIKGIVIDKERVSIDMPLKVQNAKIALISEALEVKNLEGDAKISITDPNQ